MTPDQIKQLIREELASLIRSDRFTFEKLVQFLDGRNIQVGVTTGTKIGTAGGSTGQKLSFFGNSPVVQRTSGANLTNNVTVGGTNNTIDNITTGGTVGTDIRDALYQLSRKLKEINDGLRTLGLFD